jgi:copper transport protein
VRWAAPAAVAVFAAALLPGHAPAAFAHAVLLRADPRDVCRLPNGERLPADAPGCRTGVVLDRPPAAVRLGFSEPVQPIGRGLRVVGPDGRRVDHGPVRVAGAEVAVAVDARRAGTYRAVWSVISPDTHPEFGTMTFSVDRPGGIIATGAASAGRAAAWGLGLGAFAGFLHFAGFALGFGVLTAAWLLAPRSRPDGAPSPESSEIPDAAWRLTGIGIILLFAAEPLAFAGESVALGAAGGGADPAVVGAVLDSSFGRVLSQRLGAAILLWVLAGAIRGGALRARWAVPLLGAALAFADGQAAHALGVRPAWWGLAVNMVHVSAMGLWGGTLAFVLALPPPGSRRWAWPPRAGTVAACGAVAAVATGIVMAAQHLGAVQDLATSPYGRAAAVKAGAVAGAGILAWAGARRGAPRLLGWESAAVLVVLGLAAVLVLLRPPVP